MSDQTVTIIIDGVEVTARPGQTIMEAADAVGVYIPRLCYHKDLPPGGHCRVCTVKVKSGFFVTNIKGSGWGGASDDPVLYCEVAQR